MKRHTGVCAIHFKNFRPRTGLGIWKLLAIGMLLLSCAACTERKEDAGLSIRQYPSLNFNERSEPISMIVLHYTALPTCEDALTILSSPTNPAGRVSSHYLVDRDGTIYQMVDESKRAWHAGAGSWRELDDVNSRSIGIEIVNIGLDAEGKREPFPDAQIDAVIALCKDIQERYGIAARDIVGHADMAPCRRQDPGEAFPWKKLSESGIGLWTDGFAETENPIEEMLTAIGYDVSDLGNALLAFKRHWYPEAITAGASNALGRIGAVYQLVTQEETDN